ncbi:hypothetical protein F0562_028326 [Nyssa sinensis]|uniref:MADS-box domain-containing protein n=1 Tax=Nyssa sinensis TaxID=561372 RepID=A0A5J5B626_9ASTE|nr:hypothetical protein F0562_028326 [Nyssa sinensis]
MILSTTLSWLVIEVLASSLHVYVKLANLVNKRTHQFSERHLIPSWSSTMVRSKVKYELIADERARKQTFRKRKSGLLKKVSEITTLCSVDACAIIYSNDAVQPEIWPSPIEAYHLLQRFDKLPTMKQTSNMINQETFLRQNVSRLTKNLENEKKKNRWLELEQLLTKCLVEKNLNDVNNMQDLKDLDCLLVEKIELANNRIEDIKRFDSSIAVDGNKIEDGPGCSKEKKSI